MKLGVHRVNITLPGGPTHLQTKLVPGGCGFWTLTLARMSGAWST
jgi:hypothetical protein